MLMEPNTAVNMREEARFLKYAFRAQHADPSTRDEIAKERGARWSSLNELPGWWPATNSPPDFMHAAYLGESNFCISRLATPQHESPLHRRVLLCACQHLHKLHLQLPLLRI